MADDGAPVLEPGDVVRSLKGRDRDDVALVWGVLTEHRVAIVDGDAHPVARPKPKNRRHVERIGHHKELAHRMSQGRMTDAEVRAGLEPYREAVEGTLLSPVATGGPDPAVSGNETDLANPRDGRYEVGPRAAGPDSMDPGATRPPNRSGDGLRREGEGNGARG